MLVLILNPTKGCAGEGELIYGLINHSGTLAGPVWDVKRFRIKRCVRVVNCQFR